MDSTKLETLMNAFIKSQFNYCPLVWMFHDRGSKSKINRIQERALQLVCRGSGRELEKMKEMKENNLTSQQRNLQLLMIEIFKAKNNLNPEFMKDVFFENRRNYNLRNDTLKLVALRDTQRHPYCPRSPYHIYKLIFLCELTGGTPKENIEISDIGFFDVDDLPDLSRGRTLPEDIQLLLEHRNKPELPTVFD